MNEPGAAEPPPKRRPGETAETRIPPSARVEKPLHCNRSECPRATRICYPCRRGFVAQISNLRCRRLPVGRVSKTPTSGERVTRWRIGNPRYGRLETCATLVAASPRCILRVSAVALGVLFDCGSAALGSLMSIRGFSPHRYGLFANHLSHGKTSSHLKG